MLRKKNMLIRLVLLSLVFLFSIKCEGKESSLFSPKELVMNLIKNKISQDSEITLDEKSLSDVPEDTEEILLEDIVSSVDKSHIRAEIICKSPDKVKRISISGKVLSYVMIPVLNNFKRKGEIIREEDIVNIKIDRSQVNNLVIQDRNKILGKAVNMLQINPSVPIYQHFLSEAPAVRNGQTVKLVAKGNNIEISTSGKCLETKQVGEEVRVQNSSTNKIITGVVKGEGLVVVDIRI